MPVENPKSKKDDTAFGIGADGVMPMGALVDETNADSADEGDVGIPRMTANRILRTVPTAVGGGEAIKTDDAAFTVGTDAVTPMGAMADETNPDSVNEGDVGIPRMTLDRQLRVIAGSNSGVDIGDVDVTSVVPGVAATSLGKAEDAVHASGDTGVLLLVVRKDTAAALAGADGDYAPLEVDANGYLHVKVGVNDGVDIGDVTLRDNSGNYYSAILSPDSDAKDAGNNYALPVAGILYGFNAATWDRLRTLAATGDGLGALKMGGGLDDAAFAASGVIMPIAGLADETNPDSVDEGDIGAIRMTLDRQLRVIAGSNSGVDIGDVDVLSIVPGTGATNLGKAADSVAGATDTGVTPLAIRDDALGPLTPVEGDYVPLRTDANGALWTHDDALDGALSGSELQVDVVGALPAGDNNIGNVDIVTLPAGNLGQQAMAASLSTVPANNITDATYIGDIKFGEALPAGSAIVGKVGIDQTTNGTTNAVVVRVKSDSGGSADAVANTTAWDRDSGDNEFRSHVRHELFNGATWDRPYSIAASGAGLGVQQVGTLGELITLAASAARTESANGTAVTGLGWRNRYIILFDLTVADTDAGDTLDVYVDVSLDGSTWLNAVHFTQIIGTDAASKRYAVLDPSAPGTSEILVTADAAAGVVRPSMFGPQMRARWAIVDAGTDDASFTFSVAAYAI